MDKKIKLTVVLASTREGRRGKKVADWFLPIVRADDKFEVTFADLAEYDLPYSLDFIEPSEREDKKYPDPNVQRWSDTIENSEALIFITSEYNHAMPASLKNAIDQIYWEWLEKPVGFIGYGGRGGGGDSIDSLRHTIETLKWQVAEPKVLIRGIKKIIDEEGNLTDMAEHEESAKQMLDNLAASFDSTN
ncbi:MAG TPA: NAD(P)H-dependent oxidoreductase [Patescibacteria group bacterium]|nr:NAD(P)H-dependent oxidoreductase [Patescibacteria group bacterium]